MRQAGRNRGEGELAMQTLMHAALGLALAVVCLLPTHAPAEAAIDWCDGDPVVPVTLAGKQYGLHATNGVPREHAAQIDHPTISVLASVVVGNQAMVTVAMTPHLKTNGNGLLKRDPNFPVRFRLSLPGQHLANDWSYGVPGSPMVQTLNFALK